MTITHEIWKPIRGFEGIYEASSEGSIRPVCPRFKTTEFLKAGNNGKGHPIVTLVKDKVKYPGKQVSRLVYEAFYGPIPPKTEIDHKDENTWNNKLSNLQAISHHHNMLRGTAVDRMAYDHRKPVKAYLDGVEVGHYNSIREASAFTGANASSIGKCAAGKANHAGGYKWLYAEPKEEKPKKLYER